MQSGGVTKRLQPAALTTSWLWLPDDIVARVLALVPAVALPALARLEWRTHPLAAARLLVMKRLLSLRFRAAELLSPPSYASLDGPQVVGKFGAGTTVRLKMDVRTGSPSPMYSDDAMELFCLAVTAGVRTAAFYRHPKA